MAETQKYTSEDLTALTAQEMQQAVRDGMADAMDCMAEMERRQRQTEQERDAAKAQAKSANGRTIKENSSGGLFIRDPSFKCYSADKSKEYTGCLNVDPDLFRCLLGNSSLLDDIREFLRTSGLTKFPIKGAKVVKQETPAADNGNSGAQVASALVQPGPLAGRKGK